MDIESVVTKREYKNAKNLSYEDFCSFLEKLVKLSVEESLKILPFVVIHLSKQAGYVRDLTTKFYDKNKNLKDKKELLERVIEKVESENPGMSYEDILDKAAEKANKIIPLMKNPLKLKRRDIKKVDELLRDL